MQSLNVNSLITSFKSNFVNSEDNIKATNDFLFISSESDKMNDIVVKVSEVKDAIAFLHNSFG